jgi:hypothetical protein
VTCLSKERLLVWNSDVFVDRVFARDKALVTIERNMGKLCMGDISSANIVRVSRADVVRPRKGHVRAVHDVEWDCDRVLTPQLAK